MAEVRRLQPREASVQTSVIDLAHLFRWRVAHFRPAQTKDGWRTAVAADGKGYVDLTLARDRMVFAEMKRQREKPRPEQVEWLDAIALAGGEVYVWTLDDLLEVKQILDRRHAWTFIPHGKVVADVVPTAGPTLRHHEGPRLIFGNTLYAPRCAWIPGHGRRDG